MNTETVKKTAALAHIRISEERLTEFARDLGDISSYAAALSELPTEAIPDYAADKTTSVTREDIPAASPEREIMLKNAPLVSEDGRFIAVPKTV